MPGELIPIAFFAMIAAVAIGTPLARAWARRMDRQGAPSTIPSDVQARLERMEHAIESIAVEVERISEGQRFTTKLLAERSPGREGAPAIAAAHVETRQAQEPR